MKQRGSIMLLVIIFGGIFIVLIGALTSYIIVVNRAQDNAHARLVAFNIAEAGLEYYRWFLYHFPGNTTNNTGLPGPYTINHSDPEGGILGTYTLTVTGNTACGVVQSIDVTSRGVSNSAPTVFSTLQARYAPPSVAAYSYIVGSSVWAGADRIINGPYHSNGGVRMDGTANATVSSSLSRWNCTSHFGCSPAQPLAPGVLGTGTNQDLWIFPRPQIDFAGIAANFPALKSAAVARGIYLPRHSTTHGPGMHRGYRLIFNSNSTVTVLRVNSVRTLTNVHPVDGSSGITNDHTLIDNETMHQTFTLPRDCGLIFVEDNAWLEGVIPSKVTVIAAGVIDPGFRPNIVLRNSLTYVTTDGSNGLTVIGARNILIAPDAPQNMTLHGIFVAQSGAFGRNYFSRPGGGCNNLYEPRGTLTIFGTIVSNLRTGTRWRNGCSPGTDAGFRTRISSFDRQNMLNPPPFTPVTSTQWQIVDWQQR